MCLDVESGEHLNGNVTQFPCLAFNGMRKPVSILAQRVTVNDVCLELDLSARVLTF